MSVVSYPLAAVTPAPGMAWEGLWEGPGSGPLTLGLQT